MEYKYKPTTNGRAAMAACLAMEKPLKITRVAFGSGRVDDDTNLADVHELLEYISDGAVAERRHENDRFYLTVQFANRAHPDVKTFLLTEFIVYVENPETGENTDLLYGTLGDYRQPVPAYNPAFPPSVFNFPVELIISDEINIAVSAPAGLVTYEEMIKLFNSRAAGAAAIDITIPAAGWAEDEDTEGAYPYYMDIASTDIREDMVPMLTVLPASLADAAACELCATCRTLPGALRVYTKSIPEHDISANLTVFDTSKQNGGLANSAAAAVFDIDIPVSGWETDADAASAYPIYTDIVGNGIDRDLIPALTVYPESLAAAGACGLSPYVMTLPGALRVYAKEAPANEIKASLLLLGTTQSITGSIE